jgi:predicted RNase H-like HicB family nuclease
MKKIRISADLSPADEGGYIIYCPELDIITEGETPEEAVNMLRDAAQGYIETVGIDNIIHFSPKTVKEEIELIVNG